MIEIEVDLEELKDVSGGFNRGFRRYIEDGAQQGQNVALENVPEDKGELRRKLAQFVPTYKNGKVIWGVSDAPHALPQEYGTKPYWPPIDPLKGWAQRNGMGEGFAYYVQWKIAQEGIEASPYLRPGAEAQEEWYRRNDPSEYITDEL